MKVLLIAHGVFFDPDQVVAGNSVRAYYLAKGLVDAGHSVVYIYPHGLAPYAGSTAAAEALNIPVRTYSNPEQLAAIIAWESPDALLVAYWELLADLPEHLDIPLILDLVAPRILEALFQQERDLQHEVMGMLKYYPRADLFLVGNERQRHLLVSWLIMAGIDCREHVPVAVVPICTQPGEHRPSPPGEENGFCFVSGGVSWPWRRTETWFEALAQALARDERWRGRLELLTGSYIYAGDSRRKGGGQKGGTESIGLVRTRSLLPYARMQEYLRTHCHIGVELADRNIEREYSQSFRAMEFLRSGLPLICNDYLQMADLVHKYDAGWMVRSPQDLCALIPHILDSPEQWTAKADNALRLVQEEFDYSRCVEPIVAFLRQPYRPDKGPAVVQVAWSQEGSDRESLPNGKSHLESWKNNLVSLTGKILRKIGPKAKAQENILMVTRADIVPPDHGAAVKIDRTATALSRYVPKVYLLTDDRRRYYTYFQGARSEQRYPFWLRALAPLRSLVRKRARKKEIPEQDAFLYYPLFDFSYILRTLYIALGHSVRIYQAEFPGYARPCLWARSLLGGVVLLAEHNVEYQRLRDQNPNLSLSGYEFVRRTELMLCKQVDQVITVSNEDKQRLIHDGVPAGQTHYIPHGVDLEGFEESESLDLGSLYAISQDETLLVYHGTYLYPPNMEAVQIMAEEIIPLLRQWGIRAQLLAVGPHSPVQSPWPDVVFTGSVQQVAPYLLAADMAVVPLRQGGGTRMKILDYFAAGLPVVSTAKGIEGIEVINGQQAVIVEDTGQDFARAIKSLLDDPDQAARIGRQGRVFVQELDWKIIGQKYLQLVERSSS
ncbi:MAG: glycosyltransferase [Desulfovermiculus sp.]|nr:glycosyltransferase [Desulfovermiculus sp.]